MNENDPLSKAEMLDQLAWATADSNCPVEELLKWSQREGFKLPEKVTSYSPKQEEPLTVDVSRAL